MNKIKKKLFRILLPVCTMLFFFLVWQLMITVFKISELILPPPILVLKKIISDFPLLMRNGFITLIEAAFGFMLGCIGGIIFASIFHFSKLAKEMFFPYVIAIRAIPIIAIAPLLVVWLGTGYVSKIALAAIISFSPILINMLKGIQSVEPDAIDYFITCSASQWQIFKKLRLPSSLPYLFAGMKIASSFSVIGAIVAEFTGASNGIGYIIKSSTYYSETALTFAAITIAAVIGLLFFILIVILEKLVIFWDHNKNNLKPID